MQSKGTVTKVGIDGQIFAMQQVGGISRLFSSLLDPSLQSPEGPKIYPLFTRHRNLYLSRMGIGDYTPGSHPAALLAGGANLDSNDQTRAHEAPSIIHTTFYAGEHPSPSYRDKDAPIFVASLYDMIPEIYPDFFGSSNPHHNKLAWLEQSDAIISISHSAAADLLDIRPNLADRLHVIHLGVDMNSTNNPQSNQKPLKWPYLLYIGTRNGYKNSGLVLRALARAQSSIRSHRLVFAGGGPPSPAEKSLIKGLGIDERVVFCQPNDEVLRQLYVHAQAVLVPSLGEGFSLPLIEALATDTAVLCSDISAHKEVGQGFCHFLPAANVETWASIFASVTSLERPSQLLGQRIQSVKDYYSLARMVRDHHHFYTSA